MQSCCKAYFKMISCLGKSKSLLFYGGRLMLKKIKGIIFSFSVSDY